MTTYVITPVSVAQHRFLDGLAKCGTCGARVRPSLMTSAFVRRFMPSSASASCTVCSTTTDYQLEPRRIVTTTTSAEATR